MRIKENDKLKRRLEDLRKMFKFMKNKMAAQKECHAQSVDCRSKNCQCRLKSQLVSISRKPSQYSDSLSCCLLDFLNLNCFLGSPQYVISLSVAGLSFFTKGHHPNSLSAYSYGYAKSVKLFFKKNVKYIIIHSKYFPDSDWLKAHV